MNIRDKIKALRIKKITNKAIRYIYEMIIISDEYGYSSTIYRYTGPLKLEKDVYKNIKNELTDLGFSVDFEKYGPNKAYERLNISWANNDNKTC